MSYGWCALLRALYDRQNWGKPFVLEAAGRRMVEWEVRKNENGSAASI